MLPVMFLDGDVLFSTDQVAMDPDCCCSSSSSSSDECGPIQGDAPSEIIGTIQGVAQGSDCVCDGSGSGWPPPLVPCDHCGAHNVDVLMSEILDQEGEDCANDRYFNGTPECCRIWAGSYDFGEQAPLICGSTMWGSPYPDAPYYSSISLVGLSIRLEVSRLFNTSWKTRWLRLSGRFRYYSVYAPSYFNFDWAWHVEENSTFGNGGKRWTWREIMERLASVPWSEMDYWKSGDPGIPPDPEIPPWCNWDGATVSISESE